MTTWDQDLSSLPDLEVAPEQMDLALELVAGNLGSMSPPPPAGDEAALYWFQPVMPVPGQSGPSNVRHIYLDCPTFNEHNQPLLEKWDKIAYSADPSSTTYFDSETVSADALAGLAGHIEDASEFMYLKSTVDPNSQSGETFLTQAKKLGLVVKAQALVLSTPTLTSTTIGSETFHPGLPGLGAGDNLLVGASAALYVDVISRAQIMGTTTWLPPEIRDPGPHPVREGTTNYLVMRYAEPVNSSIDVREDRTGNVVTLPLIDGGPGVRGFTLPSNLRGSLTITTISNFFASATVPGSAGGLVVVP